MQVLPRPETLVSPLVLLEMVQMFRTMMVPVAAVLVVISVQRHLATRHAVTEPRLVFEIREGHHLLGRRCLLVLDAVDGNLGLPEEVHVPVVHPAEDGAADDVAKPSGDNA